MHGLIGGVFWRQPFLDVSLDILDDHNGVVDHNADRQHQPKQSERVDGKSKDVHHREGANDRDRNRDQWNNRRPPRLQEQNNDQNDQSDGLQQRMDHRFDRCANKLGRVVDDAVVHAIGHILFQFSHGLANVVRDLNSVRARSLKNRNRYG